MSGAGLALLFLLALCVAVAFVDAWHERGIDVFDIDLGFRQRVTARPRRDRASGTGDAHPEARQGQGQASLPRGSRADASGHPKRDQKDADADIDDEGEFTWL